MSNSSRSGPIRRLLQSWMWEEPVQVKSGTWSAAIPWMIRAVLFLVCWRGISSESGLVSGTAMFVFVSLVFSSGKAIGGKPAAAVLHGGDTKIVLHEATWPHWFATERVLHDELNIHYSKTLDMLSSLPLTLEPAVVRSQAENIVAKLYKAGAVASLVTTNHDENH